jgi:predicted RNA-binding protein with PUA-like domain
MPSKKNYWLMKSEPDEFGIDDLKKVGKEAWTGVRNYQARNFMRDEMKVGDEVLFYHSNTKPPGIAGTMTVASEPYADPTQFQKKSKYYDEKATKDKPRWFLIDVKYKSTFKSFVPLETLKDEAKLKDMKILQKGNRLSITPVSKTEFDHIVKMGR